MTVATKPDAKITPGQAIKVIDEMLKDIKRNKKLQRSNFGFSVQSNLTEMRAGLQDGRRFTLRMELALENWNIAIHRDLKPRIVQ